MFTTEGLVAAKQFPPDANAVSFSLSLSLIVSHGSSSPADIWSHKRYICCYSHWHRLASGHQLCQCWLFLLGGGRNVTGTAAAQTDGHQRGAVGSLSVLRLPPNPPGATSTSLGRPYFLSQYMALSVSQFTYIARHSSLDLLTAKNSLSHNFMTPSITDGCCVSSPARLPCCCSVRL